MPDQMCTAPECDRKVFARGLCSRHYRELRMYGDVELLRTPTHRPVRSWGTMHKRVWSARGLASTHLCIDCGAPAKHWSYTHDCPDELNDGHYIFCPHVEHYEPRCVSCHIRYDLPTRKRGEEHHNVALNEESVRLARKMREETGMSYPELAAHFGVALPTIYRAIIRQTWKHVD